MKRRSFVRLCSFGATVAKLLRSADDPTLDSAKITFSLPEGDDKDDDTQVSVWVSSRLSNGFNQTLASRERFASTSTWEDTGDKSYTYDLSVAGGVKRSQISGPVRVRIVIHPNGNDTVKFGYNLVLKFSDGQEVTKDASDIVLSQDNREYSG